MARIDIEAAFARGLEAWNAHDAERLAADYAVDVVVRDNHDPELQGRDAARERAQMFMSAFPDIHIEVLKHEVVGNTLCEEWCVTGTHEGTLLGVPPTHKRTETYGATFAEFDEAGRIVSEHVYWDEAKLMRDLGVIPELGATA